MQRLLFSILAIFSFGSSLHAEPLPLQQVADGVYVHRGIHQDIDEGYQGDIANIGFVIGDKGVAVIDTGGTFKLGQRLHQAIRNITNLPILYVINTHLHPDHIYGNAAFSDDRAQFVGHAKLADSMERSRDIYAKINEKWLGEEFSGSKMVKPTLAVNNELELDLGNRQLTLKAFPPAHTSTDITVFDSKTQTLWTGDLLFIERTPAIEGDIKGWIAATEALGKSKARHVIPGHGPVVDDLQTALSKQLRYLTTLLTDIRSNIEQMGTMEEAMDKAAASERTHWILFDTVNRRNVNAIYPALEWE